LMFSVCFLLIAVPLTYSRSVFDSAFLPKFLALMFGAFFVTLSWVRLAWLGKTHPGRLPTDLPVLLFLLVVAAQWPRAYDVYQASLEVTKVLTLTVAYFALTRCSQQSHWRVWARLMALMGLLVSAIGICQYFGFAFLSLPSAGLPSATFGYRNMTAMFVIIALPFGFLQFLTAKSRREEVIGAMCWTTMLIFLTYTRTRGAWVGCLVSMIVGFSLILYRNRMRAFSAADFWRVLRSSKVVMGSISFLVILALATADPSEKVAQVSQASSMPPEKASLGNTFSTVLENASLLQRGDPGAGSGRGRFWQATVEMIADNPLWGVGLTNWEKQYPSYSPEESKNRFPRRPHNDYLWIFSELGFFGLLAYLGIFVGATFCTVSLLDHSDAGLFALIVAAFSGIVAIQTHALFSFPFERVGSLFTEWICLILIVSASRASTEPRFERRGLLVSVLSTILIVLSGSVVARATVSESLTAQSVLHLGAGRLEESLQNAKDVRRWGVFDYRQLMYHSEVYLKSGRTERAYEACREVVRRHPNSANGLQNLGKAFHGLGLYDESISAFRRAIKVRPGYVSLYRDLGLTYERIGDLENAAEVYKLGQHNDSADGWFPYKIGAIHYRLGRLTRAETYFQGSISTDDGFNKAHLGLANVLLRQGQKDQALASYLKALSLEPGDPLTHFAVARIYLSKGSTSMATEYLKSALSLTDDETLKREINLVLNQSR
jgi:tetratricopeptide (TPR) repeat protein